MPNPNLLDGIVVNRFAGSIFVILEPSPINEAACTLFNPTILPAVIVPVEIFATLKIPFNINDDVSI